jgi:hypothetical protein
MARGLHFEGFLRAVHRRMMVLRALERTGICVLGGCVILLILMPILIWRGQGTLELVGAALGAGALAGIIWGIASRPTRLAAAVEADRQLKWADLLSTALTLRQGGNDDDFARSILAIVEARSRQVSPSAVVLNRIGARGWGGIGLAVVLVAGLSLMGGAEKSRSEARAAGPRTWQEIEAARQDQGPNSAHFAGNPDLRRIVPVAERDDQDPLHSAVPDSQRSTGAAATEKGANDGAGGAQEGSGAGAGQSAPKQNTTPAMPPKAGGVDNQETGATPSGGGGRSAEGGAQDGGGGGASAGAAKPRKPSPIWQSQSWASDREAAQAAIQTGRVPDAYRDLVREYFERE